jgi:hypothetical protein
MKNKIINEKFNSSNKMKPKDELVHLINNLNSSIKSYYITTRDIILNSKENKINNAKEKQNDLINIENLLLNFIKEAKFLFNRMKIARKRSIIEEEQNKKNQGQLYNYCNNNFFYYSNAPTNVNTNSNYFTKILNHARHQKVNYKSPVSKNNNISNNKITNNKSNQYSYRKHNQNLNKIISSDNSISNEISNKISVPKLNLDKTIDKDELIKNILKLLKQLNEFHCKIFYETEEAQNYKNIFNSILSELNKLINVLSKEKDIKPEIGSLTERKPKKSLNKKNQLLVNKKYGNMLRNIENLKKNSHSLHKYNMSYNNIISRNPFNYQKYSLSIQNLKSRNESKSLNEKNKRAKSDNSNEQINFKNKIREIIQINKEKGKYLRDVLIKEGINDHNKKVEPEKKLVDKEQQTDDIKEENVITKEININFEIDEKYKEKELEREKLIKDLENKIEVSNDTIKSLTEKIINLQKENNSYKEDSEKKNKEITSLTEEVSLLKLYIDKHQKKENDKNIKENNNRNQNNNNKKKEEIETDLDKMSIRYELLKLDYNRQKNNLEEKEKILNNYNIYTNISESKSSDDKINQLIRNHQKEIEKLNDKYYKNILDLKINLPNCFSPSTHQILIDKKYKPYELRWYLLTITSAKKKDYENTFWVSEDEIKNTLNEFNKYKTEEEIEKENQDIYMFTQQKLVKRIENNEDLITDLKMQIQKLKGEKL